MLLRFGSKPPAAMRLRTYRIALAVLAAALAGCGPRSQPAPDATAVVTAAVLQVTPRSVPVVIEAVGQLEGSRQVEVRARVSGILLKQLYAEGDLVHEDQALFRIDPAPFEVALAQARAGRAEEEARNEQARREFARLKPLAAKRAVSQKEYDDAVSTLKLSDAALAAATAAVDQATLNLSYTLVRAPVTGVSGRAARTIGNLVTAGQDSSLLTTINRIRPIWVRFSISASDLERLPGGRLPSAGQIEVRLVLPDGKQYPEKGRVNFAATEIDQRLGTRQLRAAFDNPGEDLLPGQFVRVRMTAGRRDDVFLVPQTAVLQNEKGFFLFVLDGAGKAAVRSVSPGDTIGPDWVILEGLKAGDRVIVDNLLRLRPGVAVSVAPSAAAASRVTN